MQNWYNLPTYYDVSFSHEMSEELAFLKAVFYQQRKGKISSCKLLEPACGTGRLMIPLIRAGFNCTGFDLNKYALAYLEKKLHRNQLRANIFKADMANFTVKANEFDAAFCTVDTFRHLLTEKQAEQHLINIARALKENGLYILGLHLLPKQGINNKVTRWTSRRGRLTVNTSMTMLAFDKRQRKETLKVVLKSQSKKQSESYTSIYQLRTYTLRQLYKLLNKTGVFKINNVYDDSYALSHPVTLTDKSDYAVLVLKKIA